MFTCLFAEQLDHTDMPEWYGFNGEQELIGLLPYKIEKDRVSTTIEATVDATQPDTLQAAFMYIKKGFFRIKWVSTANDN